MSESLEQLLGRADEIIEMAQAMRKDIKNQNWDEARMNANDLTALSMKAGEILQDLEEVA